MNKGLINEMANMFSLMERMDKHATLIEQFANKKYYLNEGTTGGKLMTPALRFIRNGQRDDIVLDGLFREDADMIKSKSKIGNIDVVKPNNNGDTNKDIVSLTFHKAITSAKISTDLPKIVNNFFVKFLSVSKNKYDLTELQKAGDPNTAMSYYHSTVPTQVAAGFSQMSQNAVNTALENLKIENIPDIKKYLVELISGQKMTAQQLQPIAQQIARVEVGEAGSQLSPKNILMIEYQARTKYGMQPGDPEWPTFVAAPKTWAEMGRKVIDSPKHPYVYEAPSDLLTKHQAMAKYNAAHPNNPVNTFKEFQALPAQTKMLYRHVDNNDISSHMPIMGYDITDTEDTSGFDQFFNETGLINNLTGDLNSVAKAAMNGNNEAEEGAEGEDTNAQAQTTTPQQVKSALETPSVQRYLAKEAVSVLAEKLGISKIDTGNIDEDVTNMVVKICENLGSQTYKIIHPSELFTIYLAAVYVIGSLPYIDNSYALKIAHNANSKISQSGINGLINDPNKQVNAQIQKSLTEIGYSVRDHIKKIAGNPNIQIQALQASQASQNPNAGSTVNGQEEAQATNIPKPVAEMIRKANCGLITENVSVKEIIRKILL